jgi:molybdenum cofactor synthesis domain-containing protein
MQGRIVSVNIAAEKGEKKSPVPAALLVAGQGVEGDAHAGGERQVSLLAEEAIKRCIARGVDVGAGDFGENLTVAGFEPTSAAIGQRLLAGPTAILQVSQIGKICPQPCSIGRRLGDCIMPREGVFARVLRGGRVATGDAVTPTTIKVGAVLTASDRCARGERQDESGPALVRLLEELEVAAADYTILPDEEVQIRSYLAFLADRCGVDVVLTTGGTGLAPRDRTPEATLSLLDTQAPGIAEALRAEGMRHTSYACLSRGVSGLRGRTVIINLPGSKAAIEEVSPVLRVVLPHLLETLRGEGLGHGH